MPWAECRSSSLSSSWATSKRRIRPMHQACARRWRRRASSSKRALPRTDQEGLDDRAVFRYLQNAGRLLRINGRRTRVLWPLPFGTSLQPLEVEYCEVHLSFGDDVIGQHIFSGGEMKFHDVRSEVPVVALGHATGSFAS